MNAFAQIFSINYWQAQSHYASVAHVETNPNGIVRFFHWCCISPVCLLVTFWYSFHVLLRSYLYPNPSIKRDALLRAPYVKR